MAGLGYLYTFVLTDAHEIHNLGTPMSEYEPLTKPFELSHYPAYRFEEDGTPVRIIPVSRGKHIGFTGPLKPCIRKRDGYEMFSLTRVDKEVRVVSRSTILKAMGHEPSIEFVQWNPDDEGYCPLVNGFNDYMANRRGSVVRVHSPGRGHYRHPRRLQPCEHTQRSGYWYFRMQDDGGRWHHMTRDRILECAGFRPVGDADARAVLNRQDQAPARRRQQLDHQS